MKKISYLTFAIVLLLLTNSFAQGKIFTEQEALKLYGPVVESVKVYTNLSTVFSKLAGDRILVTLKDGVAEVYTEARTPILSRRAVSDKEVLFAYGKDIFREFLSKCKSKTIYFEWREKNGIRTFTVSDGGTLVLEMHNPCPPYC